MLETDDLNIKLVATDLDGTILNDYKNISPEDLTALNIMGDKLIIRVAATGRSMHKVKEVLPDNYPFDYIVFSSGGGVFDWKNKRILTAEHFNVKVLKNLIRHMINEKFNFFIYQQIPDNNLFKYHQGSEFCCEYNNYLERHSGDFELLDTNNFPLKAGQIMAIIPNDSELFEKSKSKILTSIKDIKVIRTTSPVNKEFIWMEIFPDTVSKGHGLKWLCKKLNISKDQTIGIGNDFNDLDMLEFVKYPYLLGNSPDNLKSLFPSVLKTNQQSGFSEVLRVKGIL